MLVVPLFLATIGTDLSIPVAVPVQPEEEFFGFSFRVAAGPEWDTNARRAVPDASQGVRSTEVVGDGLTRLTVDASMQVDPAEGHAIAAAYILLAKRFFSEGTEDLLVNSATLASFHRLGRWLSLTTRGIGRLSRIRGGSRDYTLGHGELALGVHPLQGLRIGLHGGVGRFDYPPEPHFDYLRSVVGGVVRYRPVAALSLSAGFDWQWRRYDENAYVIGTLISPDPDSGGFLRSNVLTFCEPEDRAQLPPGFALDCASGPRRDTQAQLSVDVEYRGTFGVGGGYLLQVQRSNSDVENIDRHRFSTFATIGLPMDFTLNLLAAVQINDGASLTDATLAEDDENQNSVQAGLSYRITNEVSVEARYALFANQFSTNDVSYLRQTIYVGVGYQAGR